MSEAKKAELLGTTAPPVVSAPKPDDPFVCHEEFRRFLPDELAALTEPQLRARSRSGRFAQFMTIGSKRNRAYWKKSEILVWGRLLYGAIRPDLIQAMLDAGFPEVNEKPKKKQIRKPKKKVKPNV